ncbi:MAG: type II toxin-antitoxin system RelB/DinJ family antitoxin [Schwartzia sp. (in: firmicutes)]
MQTTNLNVRTNHEIKRQAEAVFNELGLTMTSAINLFLRASIRQNGMPFPLTLHTPNRITREAIAEGRRMAADPKAKGYRNMDELKAALES